VHAVGHALRDESGGIEFVGAVMDVTEQHHARAALERALDEIRRSEDRLRLVIDTIPGMVWSALPDGSVDFVNQPFLEYHGLTREDVKRASVFAAVHPDDAAAAAQRFRAALATEKHPDVELRVRRADGQYRWVLSRAVPLRDEAGTIVRWYGTATDIEDRKRTEVLLTGEKRLLEMIAKGDSTALILDAFCRLFEELSSGSLTSILLLEPNTNRLRHGAAPSLPTNYTEAIDGLVIGPSVGSCGTAAYRAEPVIVSDIDTDPLWADYRDLALAHGLRACWSRPIVSSDRRVLGTFATYYREPRSPTQQEHNVIEQITHLASIAVERKQAEDAKERLEAQLHQSQKMEAMGTLAGGIAHDFNNILGAILGYGELAQKGAPEGSDVRRYLDNVMLAGGRAKSLVERILAFSRSSVGERGPINVQAVIEEALELLATSLAPGVQLDKRLEAGDAAVVGDGTQLHQVAMNLCTNALQAMKDDGVLEVVLDRAELAQDRRLSHGTLAAGGYVRLCVSDTGSGIPPHVLDRMFDPFFTTKGAGEGTGLGLSLVHSIVTDLGGAIDVRTTVGRGTTFTIWLATAGEVTVRSAEVASELPRGHGQTVIIVDDEKPLVALAEEILAELGYEPVGFSSSPAALEAFRAAPRRFDIVLTDETMPELIGTDLAHEISLLRPDIPIVLMSGYSGTPLNERARAVGVREVLRKPLQSKDIAECFGRVLR
jgi:PAS domain S-box-containing protein